MKCSAILSLYLAFFFGVTASIITAWEMRRSESLRRQEQFERRADSLGFILQRNLDNVARVTNAVAGFLSEQEEMAYEDFSGFSERMLKDSPELLSLGFAQSITQESRAEFEAQLSQRDVDNPFIWDDQNPLAPLLKNYMVTIYIEPFSLYQDLLGYNHLGNLQRQAAIKRVEDTNVAFTTNRIYLPQSIYSVMNGFVLYQPIHTNDVEGKSQFLGVVHGTFDLTNIIENTLDEMEWASIDFYLYSLDIDRLDSALFKGLDSLSDSLLLLYESDTKTIRQEFSSAQLENLHRSQSRSQLCPYGSDWTACLRTVSLQGREWTILIVPNSPPMWGLATTTLVIGLLLTTVLTLYLWMIYRRTQNTEKLVQALREARRDALTGLANRREFEHNLQTAIADAQYQGYACTLCYMDLDRFKIVNDICGHEAGDHLLCEVSQLLQRNIRKVDTLARMGGDEFCLLLQGCSITDAEQIAKTILQAISQFQFDWEQKSFQIGISIGLTVVTPHTPDASELLRQADKACYKAKQDGRNCFIIFDAQDHGTSRGESGVEWLVWLNEGLTDEFLQLYCQPTLPLKSNSARNYIEILLRLRNRPEISISLQEFIQDAERYQLMPTIDRWVLHTFLNYLSFFARETNLATDWQSNIYAINLSGLTLGDNQFSEFCKAKFEQYQIPPEVICFEITESVAIANIEKTKFLISELRTLGCSFALDDFGSGMSSFAYLRDLPIDYLKVDGSFILDLEGDHTTYNIVNAITRVGQVLGVQTVAEFVEDESLLGKLQQLGFDYAQGFGIAHPIHFEQHLQNGARTPKRR